MVKFLLWLIILLVAIASSWPSRRNLLLASSAPQPTSPASIPLLSDPGHFEGHSPAHPAHRTRRAHVAAKIGVTGTDNAALVTSLINAAKARIRATVLNAKVSYLETDIYRDPASPATRQEP